MHLVFDYILKYKIRIKLIDYLFISSISESWVFHRTIRFQLAIFVDKTQLRFLILVHIHYIEIILLTTQIP